MVANDPAQIGFDGQYGTVRPKALQFCKDSGVRLATIFSGITKIRFGAKLGKMVLEDMPNEPWECLHGWCRPRSSKPVGGVNNAPSRFDSDTLPLL